MSALVGRAHIPPLMHAHASDATGLLRSSDGNRCNKSMDNCRTFKLGGEIVYVSCCTLTTILN